jgi:hypothetical protein
MPISYPQDIIFFRKKEEGNEYADSKKKKALEQ